MTSQRTNSAAVYTAVLALPILLSMAPGAAAAADSRQEIKTAITNNWNSEMRQTGVDTFRVITRLRVSGDLEEIDKPGTSIYKAFQRLPEAAVLRAAIEGKAQGYSHLEVTGSRNLTTQRERTRVTGDKSEGDFTFAPGHYRNEIDLGVEVTFRGLKELGTTDVAKAISIEEVLAANGLIQKPAP